MDFDFHLIILIRFSGKFLFTTNVRGNTFTEILCKSIYRITKHNRRDAKLASAQIKSYSICHQTVICAARPSKEGTEKCP